MGSDQHAAVEAITMFMTWSACLMLACMRVLHTLQLERGLRLELCQASLQSEQLKLEVLRWRKQCSLMRLKLASARENVQLLERNLDMLCAREQRLAASCARTEDELAVARMQLTDANAATTAVAAEAAMHQVR
jgi:hypothetical protein